MIQLLNNGNVAVIKAFKAEYPFICPFSPDKEYPEYLFGDRNIAQKPNYVYHALREALINLKMDIENVGTPQWNPLKELVKKGDLVVLKPNFVLDRHGNSGELFSVITHPSIIRAICDYVIIALDGKGEIVIADAPEADADFDNLMLRTSLLELVNFYKANTDIKIEIRDLRQLVISNYEDSSTRETAEQDPRGYSIIDISDKSELISLKGMERIYGADFDRSEIREHHNNERHEYCIANTILQADVIINLPKIKTHRKAGVTLSMKNLVGINGNKNYLPHFRIGVPEEGGDEFERLTNSQKSKFYSKRFLQDMLLTKNYWLADRLYAFIRNVYNLFKKVKIVENTENVINGGNWSGNDTIWRTIIDLNKILIYANKEGVLKKEPQRRYFSILDGVWAGEKEGPLIPQLKKFGYVIAGFNPLITDLVTVKMMGFDFHKIPYLQNCVKNIGKELCISSIGEDEIVINSNQEEYKDYKKIDRKSERFIAAEGWKNLLN